MKDIPSAIDLKATFSNARLPDIDITENTMNKILNKSGRKGFSIRRLLVAIPLAIVLVSSTGFAIEHIWFLKGPKDIPYTYSLVKVDTEPKNYERFRKEIDSLKPGQVLFIFENKTSPKIVDTYFEPQKFYNLEEFSRKIGEQRFKSPDYIPAGYKFKEASIDISKIPETFIEELTKQCSNEKQEYFFRIADLDPNNEVIGYSLLYEKKVGEINKVMVHDGIRLHVVYGWPQEQINERKYDQEAQKIKINDFEAVLTIRDEMGEIQWLKRENNYTAYISISSLRGRSEGKLPTNYVESLKRVAESIR